MHIIIIYTHNETKSLTHFTRGIRTVLHRHYLSLCLPLFYRNICLDIHLHTYIQLHNIFTINQDIASLHNSIYF